MPCCRASCSPMCWACRWRIGAFAAGLSCALLTGYLKENSRVKEDTVMGIVFSGMFGFGLVLFTKVETDQHLMHILFGNVLGVTRAGSGRDRASSPAARCWSCCSSGATCCSIASIRNHARVDRPAGARAALRPAGAAVAHHRRVAEGGRHHPGHRHAGRARRHRLSAHRQLRAHAGHRDCRRHRRRRRSAPSSASTSTARPAPASC